MSLERRLDLLVLTTPVLRRTPDRNPFGSFFRRGVTMKVLALLSLGASAALAQSSPNVAPRTRNDSLEARMQRNRIAWANGVGMRLVDSISEAEFRKDSLGSTTVGIVHGRD